MAEGAFPELSDWHLREMKHVGRPPSQSHLPHQPPRCMARYRDHPPVELARGYHFEKDRVAEGMDPLFWTIWVEKFTLEPLPPIKEHGPRSPYLPRVDERGLMLAPKRHDGPSPGNEIRIRSRPVGVFKPPVVDNKPPDVNEYLHDFP